VVALNPLGEAYIMPLMTTIGQIKTAFENENVCLPRPHSLLIKMMKRLTLERKPYLSSIRDYSSPLYLRRGILDKDEYTTPVEEPTCVKPATLETEPGIKPTQQGLWELDSPPTAASTAVDWCSLTNITSGLGLSSLHLEHEQSESCSTDPIRKEIHISLDRNLPAAPSDQITREFTEFEIQKSQNDEGLFLDMPSRVNMEAKSATILSEAFSMDRNSQSRHTASLWSSNINQNPKIAEQHQSRPVFSNPWKRSTSNLSTGSPDGKIARTLTACSRCRQVRSNQWILLSLQLSFIPLLVTTYLTYENKFGSANHDVTLEFLAVNPAPRATQNVFTLTPLETR
jgi:hypothetical protein